MEHYVVRVYSREAGEIIGFVEDNTGRKNSFYGPDELWRFILSRAPVESPREIETGG